MNPTLNNDFWLRLLGILALETGLIVALAFTVQMVVRPAFWRRAVWQIAFVSLFLTVGAELTGLGRGLSVWLGGKPVPERKETVRLIPAEQQVIPIPNETEMAEPVFTPQPEKPVARSVWWPGILWIAGCGLVVARILSARIFLLLLRWRKPLIADAILLNRVAELAQRLGVRRKIYLLETSGLTSPMTFGMVWPTIGLPAGFARKFTEAQQDAILSHELAHLAARDPFWYLLADVVSAPLWWQPLVWWARRRLHSTSEHAADESAALLENGPGTLAECLVHLGQQMTPARSFGWLGAGGSGFRSHLSQRVERLLQLGPARHQPDGWKTLFAKTCATILFAAVVVLTSGWIQKGDARRPPSWKSALQQSWDDSFASRTMMALAEIKTPERAQSALPKTDEPSNDERAKKAKAALVEVQRQRDPAHNTNTPAAPSEGASPNLVQMNKGRSEIRLKLARIRLPEVVFEDVPVGEVFKVLRDESKKYDPEATVFKSKEKSGGFGGCFFLGVFVEDAVDLEEKFSHHGGEGDFGRFAGQAQTRLKLAQDGFLHSRQDHRAHVESPSHRGAASADVALSFPRAALPNPGSQSGQRGGFLPVERPQFGQVAQDTQGGDRADSVEGFDLPDLFLNLGGAGQRLAALLFHVGHLFFQMGHEFLLLAGDPGRQTVFGGLAGARQLVFEMVAPLHQGAQFHARGLTGRRGLGLQGVSVGGQDGGVDWIVFGALTLGQGEVTGSCGVEDADRLGGGMEHADDAFFVTAGGFTDNLDVVDGTDHFEQGGMAFGVVVQDVVLVLEVELERGLGDVQAGIDGGFVFVHSV